MNSAYFGDDTVNTVLARPLLYFGENVSEVESMWIPHHSEHCLGTADRVACDRSGSFVVWKRYSLMLVAEVKPGFVQGHDIFRTLVRDRMQHIQEKC
jgi:hypothetical protein